jgi:hypothetical protein
MSGSAKNDSEELVSMLAEKCVLSLWSYPNPRGKSPDKELCDHLVVCDPDVIIFSVKDKNLGNSGDIDVDWNRWRREAIENSSGQAYGAERWIHRAANVVTSEGAAMLPFPDADMRKVHRIVVAFGGKRQVPFSSGDFGKGFVHAIDELSLLVLLTELDTITDFVQYLSDKEAFFSGGVRIVVEGGEEDILALYLANNRSFPDNCDLIIIETGLWADFQQKPEYRAKKKADQDSYIWDQLIEEFCGHFQAGTLEYSAPLSEVERVTRTMARENRFNRRHLGASFKQFMELTETKLRRARYTISPSGIGYVFLATPHDYDREQRMLQLGARCGIVRGLNPEIKTVVGIATEEYVPGKGYSLDACYFHKEEWTDEDQALMQDLQRDFGYFTNPVVTHYQDDEYPPQWERQGFCVNDHLLFLLTADLSAVVGAVGTVEKRQLCFSTVSIALFSSCAFIRESSRVSLPATGLRR